MFGEVSLSGDIRPVSRMDSRLKEAAKLGFKRAIAPAGTDGGRVDAAPMGEGLDHRGAPEEAPTEDEADAEAPAASGSFVREHLMGVIEAILFAATSWVLRLVRSAPAVIRWVNDFFRYYVDQLEWMLARADVKNQRELSAWLYGVGEAR